MAKKKNRHESPVKVDDLTDAQIGAVLVAGALPNDMMKAVIKDSGLSENVARAAVSRARRMFPDAVGAVRTLTNEKLRELIDEKLLLTLESLTPDQIENADVKTRALLIGILTDKRQILMGQPTAIVSFQQRDELSDMKIKLAAELQRRGMLIEATATTVDAAATQIDPIAEAASD